MALPKRQHAMHSLVIPSTGKPIQFRAFTVREENTLLQAQQADDLDTIVAALREIITDCVVGDFAFDDLTLTDLEYVMVNLRAKSVGEVINLSMPCEADAAHERIPVRLELTKIKVETPADFKKIIPLYDEVGVAFKLPTVKDIKKIENATELGIIKFCIDYVYDSEEIFMAEDQTEEELDDFVVSLTHDDMEKISKHFLKALPRFEQVLSYTCPQCGKEHKKLIKGFSTFFV